MATAWGETKCLHEWTKDPRAKACWNTIWGRLGRKRPWRPEEAISTPPIDSAARQKRLREYGLAIFGEVKTIRQWTADPRCHVCADTLRKRLKKGIPPEVALGRKIPPEHRIYKRPITAFGETKNLWQWSLDPRCRVAYDTLRLAVAAGTDPETAMSRGPSEPHRYAAFGEEKTLFQWAKDPRCNVCEQTLRNRIQAGQTLGEALLKGTRLKKPKLTYQAFGESKSLEQWLKDPRCQNSRITLVQLLGQRSWHLLIR